VDRARAKVTTVEVQIICIVTRRLAAPVVPVRTYGAEQTIVVAAAAGGGKKKRTI